MATRKPIKGVLVGMAGAVVAGVIALQTGAAAEAAQFVQNVIWRLLPRDGSPVEDGEEQGQSHGPGVFVLWDLTLSMSVQAYRHRGGDPPVVACAVAAVRRPRR